jgi:hypothetical protein
MQELFGFNTREGYAPSPERLTRLRLSALSDAVGDYREQYHRLPDSLSALLAITSTSEARRPKPEWLRDGWEKNILLRVQAGRFVLVSSGPDGVPNTSDDIAVRGP